MATETHQNRMTPSSQESHGDQPSLLNRCCQVTEQSLRENPMAATMTAFGIGVGLGAIVGVMLAEPPSRSRRQTAEAIGRRMLDSIAESLPESVRQYVT